MMWNHEEDYNDIVGWAAQNYSVDPNLILAIIGAESSFNSSATRFEPSLNEYSVGLMQVLQSTAASMGWPSDVTTLSDPGVNVSAGTEYLAGLLQHYSLSDAVSAYNAGHPITGNAVYVQKVMSAYDYFQKKTSFHSRPIPAPARKAETPLLPPKSGQQSDRGLSFSQQPSLSSLFSAPVKFHLGMGLILHPDLSFAWKDGKILVEGVQLDMPGPINPRVRALEIGNWQMRIETTWGSSKLYDLSFLKTERKNIMTRFFNIIAQVLAIGAQVGMTYVHPKWGLVYQAGIAALQGALAILAHNTNPDGTPASVPYVKP